MSTSKGTLTVSAALHPLVLEQSTSLCQGPHYRKGFIVFKVQGLTHFGVLFTLVSF